MKTIKYVTPVMDEEEKLCLTKHIIIYLDDNDNMKIAIPDYYNKYVDNSNIQEALNSRFVAVYKNIPRQGFNKKNMSEIMLVVNDEDIIEDVSYMGAPINLFVNRTDHKTLIKRLK